MLETSARLLRLLSLFQTRRFWTGKDLAERLEVTERTLRRDVGRLRSLGYPVDATSGVAGGYQLAAGASLPPLQLDDDEALAVSLGLGSAASSTISGIEEAALRALVKLERVLPARLRNRANALRASILPLERKGPRVDPQMLSALASACADHKVARLRYADAGARSSERVVHPVGLVNTGYRWYLVAWDTTRDDWRTFRVDRIKSPVETGSSYTPRPLPGDGDLRSYVSRSVSVSGYGQQASIVLHAPYKTLQQSISPATGVLQRLDDRRCRLLTGAHSLDILSIHIALLGVDFEVEEPQELVEHLRTLHERLGRALASARSGSAKEPA